MAECQLDLDRLLFRSPNGSKRSIQVAKCSTPTYGYVNRFQTPVVHSVFTPWIYVRSSRPDAWNCYVMWEMWTRRCETPNFEMRGTGAKSSHTWQCISWYFVSASFFKLTQYHFLRIGAFFPQPCCRSGSFAASTAGVASAHAYPSIQQEQQHAG